jgi:Chloroplast import apparatus Tic20-like
MTAQGESTVLDRVYACLPYALPMIQGLGFGAAFFTLFPDFSRLLLLPLAPFAIVYGLIAMVFPGYGSLIIFMALFFLVVRNSSIKSFIRFNTAQALIIGIATSILGILLDLLGMPLGSLAGGTGPVALISQSLSGTIFLGVMAASIYSIVMSIGGKYAEIPVISEAAYAQVRF